MNVTELSISGVLRVEPKVFGDPRGFFVEQWRSESYEAAGMQRPFVQDNLSRSARGVLRGLHLQNPNAQAKLVSVPHGSVFDVVVDVRVGSPTFGRWLGEELSGENHRQLYIPRGCAHGFCVTSEWALFAYKCDAFYSPKTELSVRFDDPDVGVEWPSMEYTLSGKDKAAPRLKDIDSALLPRY